jgi:7,8-dihydroneopterin aldolase/epimerase/oxygenase
MIIKIKNLRLKTILGIYEWEKTIQREIVVNAEIETDNNLSMRSDDIKDAIDYDEIVTKIKKTVLEKRYKLIEKMVYDIMNLIMEDKRIKNCRLEIDKIGAVEGLDSFSVTDFRERK